MNRNARALYKQGLSSINNGPTHAVKAFEKYKGRACPTGFNERQANPDNRRKSPRGARSSSPKEKTE